MRKDGGKRHFFSWFPRKVGWICPKFSKRQGCFPNSPAVSSFSFDWQPRAKPSRWTKTLIDGVMILRRPRDIPDRWWHHDVKLWTKRCKNQWCSLMIVHCPYSIVSKVVDCYFAELRWLHEFHNLLRSGGWWGESKGHKRARVWCLERSTSDTKTKSTEGNMQTCGHILIIQHTWSYCIWWEIYSIWYEIYESSMKHACLWKNQATNPKVS